MPKIAEVMEARAVRDCVKPGHWAVGVVPGLLLQVKKATSGGTPSRSWVLRVVVGSKRRDIGLGAYPDVSLAQAREKARAARELVRQGIDPVDQARAARSALRAEQAKAVTFKQAALSYIDTHESAWRNTKHGQQWRNTLETYAYPVIGSMLVRDVEMAHVLKVLEPIWREKTETASRLRGRIEAILDWAKGRGYRAGDNPAAWKGNLDAQLPHPERIAKIEHHAALPTVEAAAFMTQLRAAEGIGARALEFVILTAARSGSVRGAAWSEIDLDAKVWTVPAERMKGRKGKSREHRVPLSSAAVKLLKAMPRIEGSDYVFTSPRGGQLSDMTLLKVIERMNRQSEKPRWVDSKGNEVVPHGFRSTFRDWTAEHTNYPNEVCEMALAHTVSNAVEAAYRRGDLLDKRRRMMDDWAAFLATPVAKGKVIPMKKRRA